MTMLDPASRDWTQASDADCYHAANGGVHQAQVELRRREAREHLTPAALKAVARNKANRR